MSQRITDSEDKIQLSKSEAKAVRRRSVALLLDVLRPVRGHLLFTLFLVILATALTTAMPWLISTAINDALEPLLAGDSSYAVTLAALYVAAAVVAGLATYTNILLTYKISQKVLFDLRQRMFEHAQKLSVGFHDTYTSGRVISRLTSDLDTIRQFLDSGLSELAAMLLSISFTIVALCLMDWRAGLALLVMMLPVTWLTAWFRRESELAYRAQRVASARIISRFAETFTGLRAVKAFCAEASSRAAYADAAEDYRVRVMQSIKVHGTYMPALQALGNTFVAIVLVIGGYSILGGSMQAGTLLALVIYANRVFEPIFMLSDYYNMFQSAVSALEKVSGFLAEEPEVAEPERPARRTAPASGHLVFDEVEFEYVEGRPTLHRLNLDIPAGQRLALVGETGAGKSTIAKLIARFYDVTHGQLTLDGVDLRDLSDEQLRREVVMVTQEAYLFKGTVADNIRLGNPAASDEEVFEAARKVGAYDFITGLPQGFDTNLSKRGGRVSAGQRQLISFARAFLADPAVLILDEATASLDIPTEKLVQQGLESLLAGRTSVVIAHRLSTVLTADRVLVVSDGRVVEDGSPAALVEAGGRFAAMAQAWEENNSTEG
ncbi:MAG TPA: ABC transporter ATP-binding protein/permease [Candidatus Rothia avistercoris]|uniref:ABC transporter ATP-binding protein/permease n=1 Tax=Candidatus Rothia avistercoris TaxID=2840479 RepID=A0A9D2ZSX4_9MICC|nr:ABC transporter ATP-binding protein [Rothia nasimurium]HJD51397.1 ABC transporter ATP-binding protein/permease [Candidatus Rothia avistercoris]